jgi:glutaminyl-peptide cyclotransferase
MRRREAWAERLKTRRLELLLLVGFVGLVVWLGFAATPVLRSMLPTPPPPAAPLPTASSTPEPPPPSAPTASAGKFDGQRALQHVVAQMAIGPRPSGSDAGRKTGDYIIAQLREQGWQVEEQEFVYRGVQGRNIVGKAGTGPVAVIGAHYDTRRLADNDPDPALRTEPVPGANDGASGVAVLLELARSLEKGHLKNEVWLTFFDAEDNGRLDGWEFIAGSQELARRLTARPEMVVIADMIGDRDQQIYKEQTSHPELVTKIWDIAARLGYDDVFLPTAKWSILDDHTPFLQKGIPAVDLIDFDYPYWHTTQDTADKVAPESLERVGRVLQVLLEGE